MAICIECQKDKLDVYEIVTRRKTKHYICRECANKSSPRRKEVDHADNNK